MQPDGTFLWLERYRQILGLSVLDFYGVSLANCGHILEAGCIEQWTRDNTQAFDNTLSWAALTNAILSAEREIMNFLGHPLGVPARGAVHPVSAGTFPSALAGPARV